MNEASARLALPLIDAGQAQKEWTHNEALIALATAVQASVIAMGVAAPPGAPQPGQAWVVGADPTGAWAGHGGEIAAWTPGGWRFLAPGEGWAVWCQASGTVARRRAGAWEVGLVRAAGVLIDGVAVVGARQPAIADPTGGTTLDARARGAITQVLEALRTHGLISR